MKVMYHDDVRRCSVADGKSIDLDSAAAKYLCRLCDGGITVQKVGKVWRLHCPQCDGPLYEVASKYIGKSRMIVVNEPTKKSKEDLFR